jgi:hypothetical protein
LSWSVLDRVRDAAEVVVLEPVGVAFEGDDVGVVDEAVDHRGGHGVVAEDFAPAAELLVAGDDERGLLGLVEVVRGQDDRRPAWARESMRPQNSRRACGRNRLWFVEKEQVGTAEDAQRNVQATPLAAGEVP